ncbi:MAG TPA: hypothetical protein PKX90_12330 [bacterium]|nr:hypothetical protein [bacterium]
MPIDTYQIFNNLKNIFNEEIAIEMMKIISEIIKTIYEEQKRMVTKEEFNELKEIVKELAEAQKRTEQKVEELAEAQKRTEQKVEELAEAQKNAEKQIAELSLKMSNLYDEVGKISNAVGYMLENESLAYLPILLKKDYDIEVIDSLERLYLTDSKGKKIEINIFGKCKKNGEEYTIIGEVKSKLTIKKIDDFIKSRIEPFKEQYKKIIPIIVTHNVSTLEVKEYAKSKGILFYYSYSLKNISVKLLMKKE